MQQGRYERQVRFQPFGESGQQNLRSAHVIVVGCGALGCISADLLARAGVGKLTIVDRDYVELSNLQRQTLYTEQDAMDAIPKAVAAERRLRAVNSEVEIRGVVTDLRPSNARELLPDANVIVDATDNFEARYLINDYAVVSGTPWIYGGAVGSYGITMTVLPGDTACFRCLYPQPPTGAQPTCETAGVLASTTSLIGSLQAAAAIKIASGNRPKMEIVSADLWDGALRTTPMPERDADCPCCVRREFPWLDGKAEAPVSLCGRNAVQIHSRGREVNLPSLHARLARSGDVRSNEFALRFTFPPLEMTVFSDGRAIVKGTTDPAVARSWYARWVGA